MGLLFVFAAVLHAHPGHNGHGTETASALHSVGLGWGLAHPFTGLDHVLAMVAVGLWAVQFGGRGLWALPLSFIGAMAAGLGCGSIGLVSLEGAVIEPLLVGSVLTLGALVAFAVRLPMLPSAALVAACAFLHGQAHGAELPAGMSAGMAALGVLLSTAALHAAGVLGGVTLIRQAKTRGFQLAGAAIVAAALLLALGV